MAINAPDVSPEPVSSVHFSADVTPTTLGGGPGIEQQVRESQGIASDVAEIATFEKIRADQAKVDNAQSKSLAYKEDLLYNPETGVLGSKGEDSVEAHQEGITKLKKYLNNVSSTLEGDEQKGPFNKWAQSLAGVTNQTMMSHVDTQLAVHRKNVFENIQEQSAAGAALNNGNPDAIDFYRNTANQAALNYARDSRMDPDATRQIVRDTNDKTQIGVINGMLKYATYDDAKNYLDENKDNISLKAQEVIQKTMVEGYLRHQAILAANDAHAKHPDSETDALAALNKISNPDVLDLARKKLSADYAQDRQAIKNDQDQIFLEMQEMVNKKGLTDPVDRRNAVPESKWNMLTGEQRRAIEKGGSMDVTSIRKWADFDQMRKDGTLKDLSQADFMTKFTPYFSPEDAKQALNAWSAASKGGANDPKAARDQSIAQSIDQSLTTAGVIHADPKLRHDKEKMLLKQAGDDIHRQIVEFQSANNGKQPKPEELQKIIDKHTIDTIGQKPDSIFAKVGNLISGTKVTPYETIPDQAKNDILASARQHGKILSKDDIEKAYPNWLVWKKTKK